MTRYLGVLLCVVLVGVLSVVLIGRAIDTETPTRVIFTRDGVTFDCERHIVEAGETISYEDGSSEIAGAGGAVIYRDCHTVL